MTAGTGGRSAAGWRAGGLAVLAASAWWLAAGGGVARAQGEKLPPAEEIIARSIEAQGGRAALEKLRNRVTHGRVEFVPAGLKGPLVSYEAAPNKRYTVVELEGVGRIESGSDGEVHWEMSPVMPPRVLTGEEQAVHARQDAFLGLLRWQELYTRAECTELVDVEGHPCYKVVFVPRVGEPEVVFFDRKTLLPRKVSLVLSSPVGPLTVETLLGDYRPVDGCPVPHRQEQRIVGTDRSQVIVIERVEHNVDLPADRFALPAPIRALREQSSTQPQTAPGPPARPGPPGAP